MSGPVGHPVERGASQDTATCGSPWSLSGDDRRDIVPSVWPGVRVVVTRGVAEGQLLAVGRDHVALRPGLRALVEQVPVGGGEDHACVETILQVLRAARMIRCPWRSR